MANRGDRGGSRTRAHIAAVATELFLARGFDDVTIAQVAAAAGVSKVTVFAHFERKEDLLLDRLPEAVDIVRSAIRERPEGKSVVDTMRETAVRLADERHPLSCLRDGGEPMLRTLMDSSALIGRLRLFEHEIESILAADLEADPGFSGNPVLSAALLVAAYRTVAVETARRRLSGDKIEHVVTVHRTNLMEAFDSVAKGISDQ